MVRKRSVPPPARSAPSPGQRSRSALKRERILDAAMRHFAEKGYEGARVEDMARELVIAKGSIFQHFKTKENLFLETYKKAVQPIQKYLDAPDEVRARGFFAVLRYWLERTEDLIRAESASFRVTFLGDYGTDVSLKRKINRFLIAEDPFGTRAFVQMGIERGEVRSDVDPAMLASMVDWMMERFEEPFLNEESDRGYLGRPGGLRGKKPNRIASFLEILRGAIGRR